MILKLRRKLCGLNRTSNIRSVFVLLPFVLFSAENTHSEAFNEERAKFNYQMFCQGCHVGNGVGGKSVPNLKGFMGHFLKSQKGREYLVKVPGSANSVLSDAQLAEVLNWKLREFAEDSIPDNWAQYTGEEVAKYRKDPLLEVVEYRKQLIAEILNNE